MDVRFVASFVFLFVFMMGFVVAVAESSVVQADFYIPEPIADGEFSVAWVFWGIGVLIVVLIVLAYALGLFRKKKVVTSVKRVKTSKKGKKK
jgi:hypothetical protein